MGVGLCTTLPSFLVRFGAFAVGVGTVLCRVLDLLPAKGCDGLCGTRVLLLAAGEALGVGLCSGLCVDIGAEAFVVGLEIVLALLPAKGRDFAVGPCISACAALPLLPAKVGAFFVGLFIIPSTVLSFLIERVASVLVGLSIAPLLANDGDVRARLGIVLCVELAFILDLVFTLTLEFALILDDAFTFVGVFSLLLLSMFTPALVIRSSVFRIISSSDPSSLSIVEVEVPDLSISFASLIRSEDISDKSAMILDRRFISLAFFCMAAACCDWRVTALFRLFRRCETEISSLAFFCCSLFVL